YHKDIKNSKTRTAIAETDANSPDRYVNRYEKASLVFYGAEKRFGSSNLFAFLKSYYSEYKGTRKATTKNFLKGVKVSLGEKAEKYFSDLLFQKDWSSVDLDWLVEQKSK
ncbi:MAG: hypothetical protein HON90_07485, partial [Halobacteriovoraceae bacterium]|nr:hypothetical protein [Halobacteriovoraceae bacterium]